MSCRKDTVASMTWKMTDQKWITGDIREMSITAPDTTKPYLMDIRLEHLVAYPFQNLYIQLITIFPSGKEIKSVTSLELANPDGSWAGDCSGKTCSITLPLHQAFSFPEIGTYKLRIEPYMRMDTIVGLKQMTVICRRRAE